MEQPMQFTSAFAKGLTNYVDSEVLSDCNLMADGKTFKGHKIILAAGSGYFYTQFYEQKQENVDLPEPLSAKYAGFHRPYDAFPLVLRYLYSNQSRSVLNDNLSTSNAFPIFSLANVLEIPTLLEYTGQFIAEKVLTNENASEILYEGIKFQSRTLIEAAKTKTIANFEKQYTISTELEALQSLPLEYILQILNSDDLNVSNENVVFQFAISYLRIRNEIHQEIEEQPEEAILDIHQLAEKRLKIKALTDTEKFTLLSSVRFPMMKHIELLRATSDQLVAVAKDLILEAISIQLAQLENLSTNYPYSVKSVPRNTYLQQSVASEGRASDSSPERSYEEQEDRIDLDVHQRGYQTWQNRQSTHDQRMFLSKSPSATQGPRPPQKLLRTSPYAFRNSPTEFIYQYDFDDNGALYYLGSLGKSRSYQNPHIIGQVIAFASSVGFGKIEELVGRAVTGLRTSNEPNSFFGVDLGAGRLLSPTAYTIRNRKSSTHVCLNWQFQGSTDGQNWSILDRREHFTGDINFDDEMKIERQNLMKPGATSTWGIADDLIQSPEGYLGFRFFRIVQIGKNSSGSFNLAISGLEMYGHVIEGNWP